MKRALLLLALCACKKPDTLESTAEAGVPLPTVSASSAPATSASASSPAAPASAYAFMKQSDWLGRWTIDIPSSFTKTDNHQCTDSGCTTRTSYAGDGILIELDEPIGRTPTTPAAAAGLRAAKIVEQKTLPRGFWVAMTAKDNHVFVQQISGFAEPVTLTVTGPLARKAEIEALIGRLSASLVVATVRPSTYCRPLPWGDGGSAGQSADFDGKLVVGVGMNGLAKNEKPIILQLDPPLCDAQGLACWEAQVYSSTKPDPKDLVGKQVHVMGDFHSMETAHHHRAIMIAAKTIGVK